MEEPIILLVVVSAFNVPNALVHRDKILHHAGYLLLVGHLPRAKYRASHLVGRGDGDGVKRCSRLIPPMLPIIYVPTKNILGKPAKLKRRNDVKRLPRCVDYVEALVKQIVRKDSQHSSKAQTVRRNVPYPAPESFRFDPNTATVEDFCRLGFTPKQAESIHAYRQKGGRFHRKSDFAKSYVVSDSVYKRLEQYIDIPLLDLNDADSAALDALPGIGGWYASKIIEYRNSLGGYSCKEQLLEIYRFDQQKYDALKDLVTIKEPYVYPLWSLPADSLRKHPYIRNYETAKAIVMFREHNPPDAWTVEQLRSAGVISSESATLISVCAQHK